MAVHQLKTWPAPFEAILHGSKRHEVRKQDRDFNVGDVLLLREYDPDRAEYTGRSTIMVVTYLSAGGTWGLPDGLCVMSIASTIEHPDDQVRAHVERAKRCEEAK